MPHATSPHKAMKTITIVAWACLSPVWGFAASNASYSASDGPGAALDANTNTVDLWTVSPTGNNDFRGSFLASSSLNGVVPSGAGAGTSAWGIYANSGNSITSTHTFAGGALNVGQSVSLQFDNGWVDPGRTVGIRLLAASTPVFTFQFTGGIPNYQYIDLGGTNATTQAYTDAGGLFSFTRTADTAYSASFIAANWAGSLVTGDITGIQVFNNSAGSDSPRDVFFNNLNIVPEPSSALLLLLGGPAVFIVLRLRRTRR